ncbi:hypothetical protein AB205_0043660 [Aquarana catesbeiana]|uniref:Uncharacterized protein n=1 Tax=Aquarana catesbeiana TaxID=8400 RepID=A0A2G9RWB1_AQUCT|nr:hypothetical protein AB205_0043660 [Aquarana catesbeiana]
MTKICVCVCFADGTDANEILGPDADDIGCTEVHDEECDSDVENEQNHDPNVEEFLQQSDTAVIYPEAPEDDQRQGTPEASGHDENGTPFYLSVTQSRTSSPRDPWSWRTLRTRPKCRFLKGMYLYALLPTRAILPTHIIVQRSGSGSLSFSNKTWKLIGFSAEL